MIVGPVDWGAHDGDLVERALSVMLLQDAPRAWRRIASRGDAGVDVAVPHPDGVEVFQIKSFVGALTGTRKADIARSLQRVRDGAALDRPVSAWRLLVPMGPTIESERWFDDLTADAPFECEWLGLGHIELLAANNPHVVDYFFRDGKARVEHRFRDLLRMQSILESAEVGPRPAEIRNGLGQLLEALNREDPNFTYAFEASPVAPPAAVENARPGLLMSVTECAGTGGCVTIRVFARHRHALEERPITVRFAVSPEGAGLLQQALDFGSATELGEDVVSSFVVDAPGGLGYSSNSGVLRVSSFRDEDFVPFRLLLTVRDPEGRERACTSVAVVERRPGNRGKSVESRVVVCEASDADGHLVNLG